MTEDASHLRTRKGPDTVRAFSCLCWQRGASQKQIANTQLTPPRTGLRQESSPAILEIDHRCALELKQETEGVGDVRLCDQGLNLPKRSV